MCLDSIDYFPDPNQWEDSNALEEDTTLQSKAKAKRKFSILVLSTNIKSRVRY